MTTGPARPHPLPAHDASVFLYAFDLIELDGDDLRREQIEARKAELANLLRNLTSALRSRRGRWVHSHGER
jgi:ATP-dependent DNA ligase